MTPTDVVTLCRYIRALTPAQRFDDYTADAWSDLFDGLPISLEQAKKATIRVKRTKAFIDPHDIITECRSLMAEHVRTLRDGPECPHGVNGGAAIHPDTGTQLCPLCRITPEGTPA